MTANFVFDTGASTLTISNDLADRLISSNKITKDDFIGYKNFVDASGNTTKSKMVNIKDLEIGGLHVHNVEASINPGLNAPMLLGQSVIEKLGSITIAKLFKGKIT